MEQGDYKGLHDGCKTVTHAWMSMEDKMSYSLAMMENKVRYFTNDEFAGSIAHFVMEQ